MSKINPRAFLAERRGILAIPIYTPLKPEIRHIILHSSKDPDYDVPAFREGRTGFRRILPPPKEAYEHSFICGRCITAMDFLTYQRRNLTL